MSAEDYVLASVYNMETMLKEYGNEGLSKSKKQWTSPMDKDYRPELDVSKELNGELVSCYMQLIGVLQWVVEIGRYDIAMEVSLLSQHNELPQEGHLDAIYGIFAYLKKLPKRCISFEPSNPSVDMDGFNTETD